MRKVTLSHSHLYDSSSELNDVAQMFRPCTGSISIDLNEQVASVRAHSRGLFYSSDTSTHIRFMTPFVPSELLAQMVRSNHSNIKEAFDDLVHDLPYRERSDCVDIQGEEMLL